VLVQSRFTAYLRGVTLAGALIAAAASVVAQTGSVRLQLQNFHGDRISAAEVNLLGQDGKPVRTARTDVHGEVAWADLPVGISRISIDASGFRRVETTISIQGFAEAFQVAILEPGSVFADPPVGARHPADLYEWNPSVETLRSPIPSELPTSPPETKKPKRRHWFHFW